MEIVNSILSSITDILALAGSVVKVLLNFLPLIIGVFLIVAVLNYRDELKYKRITFSRINEIDNLPLHKFKLFLRSLLSWRQYEVTIPEEEVPEKEVPEEETKERQNKEEKKNSGLTVDLLTEKEGVRYAVLVERKEKGVGETAFYKLAKGMEQFDCGAGLLINNGRFTEEELQEAAAKNIKLWDRDKLIKELLRLQSLEDTADRSFAFYIKDFCNWVWKG